MTTDRNYTDVELIESQDQGWEARYEIQQNMTVADWEALIRFSLIFDPATDDAYRTKSEGRRRLTRSKSSEKNNANRAWARMVRRGEIVSVGLGGGKNARYALQTECERVQALTDARRREEEAQRIEKRDATLAAFLRNYTGRTEEDILAALTAAYEMGRDHG